jgi:hypothetical protein
MFLDKECTMDNSNNIIFVLLHKASQLKDTCIHISSYCATCHADSSLLQFKSPITSSNYEVATSGSSVQILFHSNFIFSNERTIKLE